MEPADMSDMIPVTDEDRYLFDLQVRYGTAPREGASNVLRSCVSRLPLATLARCRVTPSHATRERHGAAGSLPDRSIA
jgi:hypothetical protein